MDFQQPNLGVVVDQQAADKGKAARAFGGAAAWLCWTLTIGLVIAGGYVMARAADTGWQSGLVTAAAVGLMLATRLSPLWILIAGGALGGLGLL